MSRAEASAAYAALPLPDTSEEHWRFTDLTGFAPGSVTGKQIRSGRRGNR